MRFRIDIEHADRAFECAGQQSVLAAMTDRGLKGLAVGCRSGGCGVCRVQVLEGQWDAGPMSAAQIDAEAKRQGYALACRLYPRSDLRLRAVGRRIVAAAPPSAPTASTDTPAAP